MSSGTFFSPATADDTVSERYVTVVLACLDGSDASMQAVEYAVAVAERYGASLHALHVVDDETSRALEHGAIDPATVAAFCRECLDHVDDLASEEGIEVSESCARGFSPRRKGHHPGTVVLETADHVGADFIVLPRGSVADDPVAVLDSAAEYVLSYASQPVLSV